MPLTPSDTQFLNKLLDNRLKAARLWPWHRWFCLGTGVLLIILGMWVYRLSGQLQSILTELGPHAATIRHALLASTRPVTQGELQTSLEIHDALALGHAQFVVVLSLFYGGAIFLCFLGSCGIAFTLTHWNRHRRDTLLITLLRQKCAPELTPPTLK